MIMFYVCQDFVFEYNSDEGDLTLMEYNVMIIYNMIELMYLFIALIVTNFNNKKMLHFLNTLTDIESKLLKLNIEMDYETITLICGNVLIIWSFLTTYMIVLNAIEGDLVRNSIIGYVILSEQLFILKYLTILLILRHILKRFNQHLQKLYLDAHFSTSIMMNRNYRIRMFKKLAAMYQEFFELVNNFNSLISLTCLFDIGGNFAFLVIVAYSLSTLLYAESLPKLSTNPVKMILSASALTFSIMAIVVQAFVAELYVAEVDLYIRGFPHTLGVFSGVST